VERNPLNMPLLLLAHIGTGIAGVASGGVALFVRKGSAAHRTIGNIFFFSMLTMSASGAYMAAFWKPVTINVIAGVLTFYLVATARLTVIRKESTVGRWEYVLLLLALLDGAAALYVGRDGSADGAYYVFGAVALLAAGADVSVLIRGGIAGSQRIARHLWRMCLPLAIATMSLFVGTPSQLLVPAVLRESSLRFVPLGVVFVTMVYWLCRVGYTRTPIAVVGSTWTISRAVGERFFKPSE
jgi:uncharacterized membrane protein